MKFREGIPRRFTPGQLQEVKDNVDWRQVFMAIGLERHGTKSRDYDWWALSPFQAEKTASFHIDNSGCYHCFASGIGGDMLDLVKRLQGLDNAYQAARWLLEHNCSFLGNAPALPVHVEQDKTVAKLRAATETSSREGEKKANAPIRQSLLPLLSEQGTHPQFQERGISAAT